MDDQPCLLPQLFQVIVGSDLRGKDVHDDTAQVQEDPARVGLTFYGKASFASSMDLLPNLVRDGLELGAAVNRAQHKIVRHQSHAPHVQQDYIGAKTLGDGIDDYVGELDRFQSSTSIMSNLFGIGRTSPGAIGPDLSEILAHPLPMGSGPVDPRTDRAGAEGSLGLRHIGRHAC